MDVLLTEGAGIGGGPTVTKTVAGADAPTILDAVNWKLSEPEKPELGV